MRIVTRRAGADDGIKTNRGTKEFDLVLDRKKDSAKLKRYVPAGRGQYILKKKSRIN